MARCWCLAEEPRPAVGHLRSLLASTSKPTTEKPASSGKCVVEKVRTHDYESEWNQNRPMEAFAMRNEKEKNPERHLNDAQDRTENPKDLRPKCHANILLASHEVAGAQLRLDGDQ